MYECELCKKTYRNENDAIDCESHGKEIPLVKSGDMVLYEVRMSGGWNPFQVPMRVASVEDEGHFIRYTFEELNEDNEWEESNYCMSGIFGNENFEDRCKMK